MINWDDELVIPTHEYWPASDMLRGLNVSVEMNDEELILDTGDSVTRSLKGTSVHHNMSTVTLVSTEFGSVTLQVRVWEVPSYSGPLGTLRSKVGVGTA